MFKRTSILTLKLCAVLLAACAAPAVELATRQPAPSASTGSNPVIEPTSSPEGVEEVLNDDAIPMTRPDQPEGTSGAPFESGVPLAVWGSQRGAVHLVDPATGQDLAGNEPLDLGQWSVRALSPDGRWLAAVTYPGSNHWEGSLHLLDLAGWRDVETSLEYDDNVVALAFSLDGSRLAVAAGNWRVNRVQVVNVQTPALVAEGELAFMPRRMAFSADGSQLAVYGSASDDGNGLNTESHAALLDARTLEVRWQAALPGVLDGGYVEGDPATADPHTGIWYEPGLTFAPDGSKLYIVHADSDRLTTVDFAERSVSSVEVRPAQAWLDRFMGLTARVAHAKILNGTIRQAALSPDGTRLYASGYVVDSTAGGGNTVNFSHTPLGVQLIDPASGVELLRLENEATQIGLSPDGAWLFATGWSNLNTLEAPWTQVYQADHLTPVAQIDQGRLAETARIDGSPVLASYYPDASGVTLSVVDADTFEPLARWWVPGYAEWLPRP